MGKRLLVAAWVAVLVLGVAGCGSDDDTGAQASGSDAPELIVSAASSLTGAFTAFGQQYIDVSVRFQFAGSDDLAAQIRQGVKPDVFAAANTALPDALYDEGLVEKPIVFAGNQLVMAVPSKGGKVHSLTDLEKPGVTIAIGSESVPIGAYTREVLGRLGPTRAKAILANVRSNEPDVKGIVGKLTQGAVDAGFVYLTDVIAAKKQLGATLLPERLQPQVAYAVAVVKGAPHAREARLFAAGLRHGAGAKALRAAGFDPPPGASAR